MSLGSKLKKFEKTVSAGIHEVYSGLNRPDYGVPPKLGGDSPEQINFLVILVLVLVCASIGLGLFLDSNCRGKMMEGRPRFWSMLLLLASYLLLIPGLINPVFSFSIVINVIGHRKVVEPERGHPVCTETTTGLAHLLWKTGSKMGAFLVILFSMVIPALELIMLILGETLRFGSAQCAEVFRWVIIWVQHRSKWASPDMFAYVLLVDLVRTLDVEPLILSRARLEIGFSCFSTFVVTATVSSLGIPFPQVQSAQQRPTAPILLRLLGTKGIAVITLLLALVFMPVFFKGLYSPCMSFHIETKQLFPPYGPLPESAKPAIDILDLKDLLRSETSIASCIQDYLARLPEWEANTFISLALMVVCVVGTTLMDMIFLSLAALELAFGNLKNPLSNLAKVNSVLGHSWIDMARVLRKLSMLDVAMVGVYLVTVCMGMYAKYGVVVSLEHGMIILLASEIVHSITYYIVESAWSHREKEVQREVQRLAELETELTDGGLCCPICSQSLLGPSAKYHIKVCARHTLAQLDTCASCGRLVRKDDLEEHTKRCKGKGRSLEGNQEDLSEDSKKAWQERAKLLRLTLAKIEAGEIGSLDPRGFFVCSICGQQGLGLVEVLAHEEQCRERLSAEGRVSQANSKDEKQALQLLLVDKLAALKSEVAEAAMVDGHDPGELLSLSLDRLRDVAKNACFREEKKYRRLRMSNAAVAEAIGRWKAAVEMLEAIGFELMMHTSKTGGESEPHLILTSQLAEATFKVYLDVLDGKEMDAGSSMLEECRHCKRKFRFDRIAKHETRCPESKTKPAKLDVVAKLLAGTPGERHIPEVRRSLQNCVKLPPLKMKSRESQELDGETCFLQECLRCKRRFSAEALEKHVKRCTATPGGSGRLNPLPERSQTPRSVRPSSSSSRHKDAESETKREAESRSSRSREKIGRSKTSEGFDSARGSRERVQRPLTPKRKPEAVPPPVPVETHVKPESVRHKRASAGSSGPGYPHGLQKMGLQRLAPSYEQLELDVADWLNE